MTYITGAIYPSGDRIRIGAPEEETLNAYQQPNTAVAPRIRQPRHPRTTRPARNLQPARTRHRRRRTRPPARQTRTIRRLPLHRHPPRHLSRQRRRSAPQRTAPLHRPPLHLALVRDEQRSNRNINDQFNLLYATPDASPPDCCTASSTAPSTGTHLCSTASKRQRRNRRHSLLHQRAARRQLPRTAHLRTAQPGYRLPACLPTPRIHDWPHYRRLRTGALDPSPYPGVSDEERTKKRSSLPGNSATCSTT